MDYGKRQMGGRAKCAYILRIADRTLQQPKANAHTHALFKHLACSCVHDTWTRNVAIFTYRLLNMILFLCRKLLYAFGHLINRLVIIIEYIIAHKIHCVSNSCQITYIICLNSRFMVTQTRCACVYLQRTCSGCKTHNMQHVHNIRSSYLYI